MRRTEPRRQFELRCDCVDGDDQRGCLEPRALDHRETDTAAADDRARGASRLGSGVADRPHPGGDGATDERDEVQGCVRSDLDGTGLWDHDPFGEGGHPEVVMQWLAIE